MAKKGETKKPAAKKDVVEEPKSIDVKKSDIDLAIAEIKNLKVPRRKVAKTLALLGSLANVLK